MTPARRRPGLLVLADGAVFEGELVGTQAEVATGELVFNTVLAGYQEVITDPSYAGQVIAFTYPHIGNYGTSPDDDESARPHCRGIVVRDLARRPSSWRATEDLDSYLRRHGVPGIAEVDTRRLTRHLRTEGSMPCAFGWAAGAELRAAAAAEPGTEGVDLVATVTTAQAYTVGATGAAQSTGAPATTSGGEDRERTYSIVAYDYGIKRSMLRHLSTMATVEVVPASTPAADVLARRPDGVFLSNGPGDPAAVGYAVENIAALVGQVPVFGICLGHQLLAAALGGTTEKLRFGHHGGNHPVRRLAGGTVEITSQNHNYAVAPGLDAEVTHVNLNDGVIEGLAVPSERLFSVQYHPEAGPGPHDARYLFAQFEELMSRAPAR
jgi:carbamoyl-phosphate synthase small subunit